MNLLFKHSNSLLFRMFPFDLRSLSNRKRFRGQGPGRGRGRGRGRRRGRGRSSSSRSSIMHTVQTVISVTPFFCFSLTRFLKTGID